MFLSTFLKPSTRRSSVTSIIQKTIDEVGMQEWARLTQSQLRSPSSDPNLIPSREELLSRTKTDFDQFIFSLQNLLKKTSPADIVNLLSQAIGLAFSFCLPQIDLVFKPKGDLSRELFFHRPLVVYFQIVLQWWKSILSKVERHPDLTLGEKQQIQALTHTVQAFEKGSGAGIYRKDLLIKTLQSFSIIKKRGTFQLRVEPVFFKWLEDNLLSF